MTRCISRGHTELSRFAMSSVDLTRLDAQLEALFKSYTNADIFIRNLNTLLLLYSNQAYAAGTGVIASTPASAYRVPEAVMEALEKRFLTRVPTQPESSLEIADKLWHHTQVENKHLALNILQLQPKQNLLKVTWRVKRWVKEDNEPAVMRELVLLGCAGYLRDNPNAFLKQVRRWLSDNNSEIRSAGFFGFLALTQHPQLRDDPLLLDLIQNILAESNFTQTSIILEILEKIIARHPAETAAVLIHVLSSNNNFTLRNLVRRSLEFFPTGYANSIRQALNT